MISINRVGKIKISKELLEEFWKINKDFIPIKATEEECSFEYVCISNYFRPININELVPSYDIQYIRDEVGNIFLNKVEELK